MAVKKAKLAAIGFSCMDVYDKLNKSYPTGNGVDWGVHLARLGMDVSVVSVTGNDEYGWIMREMLRGEKIDISHLHEMEGETCQMKMDLIGGVDRVHLEEIEGVMRIFGVFNDPLDAIAERLECIKNNWSSKSVPEKEYFKDDFNSTILDYSNSRTTYLEDEEVFDDESFYLSFPVTVGKSYKNKGWAVKRGYLDSFVPKIPYEKECTIFVEGIEIKGKLNIHTRLFYFTNQKLSSYLEKLSSIDPKTQAKVDLELSYGNYVLKDSDEDFITFTTTFSKSFKSGMFAMPRKFSKEILPILPYEEECIFSVGEVDASGKFNLEFRFLFNSDSIIPKLTSMKEDGEEIKVVLLLD